MSLKKEFKFYLRTAAVLGGVALFVLAASIVLAELLSFIFRMAQL